MMLSVFAVICFLRLLAAENGKITIDTKLGKMEGITDKFGSYVFRNIPYAQPPVDSLRWRPPVPIKNKKSNDVFDATDPGPACIQGSMAAAMMINGTNGNMSENCLFLGIQTPYQFNQPKTQSLRPVLFWIHGGGLAAGAGAGYLYGNLAQTQDIVIVSINYRLGLGAWLVDPQLYNSPTGNGGATGFLDMIEALKWTREHIESFGGDKNEITIAGESGGGWAVCGLLLSPLAKGLFKQSIQMSGTCIESLGKFMSREEAWDMAHKVEKNNNVTTFDELRDMSLQDIVDNFVFSGETVLPSIDGYVFPMSSLELLKNGVVNGESTMLGTVFRESFTERPFNMGNPPQSLDELNAYYDDKLFDTQAELMRKYYPENEIATKIWSYGKSDFDNNTASLIQTVQTTDCWVKCGSIWQADMMASNPITKKSFPVYFYQYGYIEQPYDQVSHGYDIIGLFGEDIAWINGGVEYSKKFVEISQKFFGDYVKGIVPKKDGKVVTVQNGYYIQVVEDVKVVEYNDLDYIRNRCEVYKIFGDSIWRNSFCMGIYPEDMTAETMEAFLNTTETDGASDQCNDGSCEQQES